MGTYRQRLVLTAMLLLTLSLPLAAGRDPATRACRDGIGYRSNLIDPVNRYARPKYLMTSQLLERYGLITAASGASTRNYGGGSGEERALAQDAYVAKVRSYLSMPDASKVERPFEDYHYAWGRCESNDLPSAIAYIDAVYHALGKGSATDALIMARHRLLQLCEVENDQAQIALIDEIEGSLLALDGDAQAADWLNYLRAATAFYQGSKGEEGTSLRMFASLRDSQHDWIRDTAYYMDVRMAKERTACSDATSVQDLKIARDAYLLNHQNGIYALTVRDLGQYLASCEPDEEKAFELMTTRFDEVIEKGSSVPDEQRRSILHDLMVDEYRAGGETSTNTSTF